MDLNQVAPQIPVQLNQIEEIEEDALIGDGLGGHQAHVGENRGRGIGRMIVDSLQTVEKLFSNFFIKIGEMFLPRQNNVDEAVVDKAVVDEAVVLFRENLTITNHEIETVLTPQFYLEASVQCMSDDKAVQQFLLSNIENTDFSTETFTAIKPHPDDKAKFIAQFGARELTFSSRNATNGELRSITLIEKLASLETNYKNLQELILQDCGTARDPMIRYIASPPIGVLKLSALQLSEANKDALWREVSHDMVGDITLDQLIDRQSLNL